MPRFDYDPAAMDAAAEVASKALDAMVCRLSPEGQAGARAVADWFEMYFMQAGYKRMCRLLRRNLSHNAKGGLIDEPKD